MDIANSSGYLPQTSYNLFDNTDSRQQPAEGADFRSLLQHFNDNGFLRSGQTLSDAAELMNGDAESRVGQIVSENQTAADSQRQQRLKDVLSKRDEEWQKLQEGYQTEEENAKAEMDKMLKELKASLLKKDQGGGFDFGQAVGQVAAGALNITFGGLPLVIGQATGVNFGDLVVGGLSGGSYHGSSSAGINGFGSGFGQDQHKDLHDMLASVGNPDTQGLTKTAAVGFGGTLAGIGQIQQSYQSNNRNARR